ncbi:hypothetical protein L3Q82_017447 [Scortum barcoo]|uniref:Uncharacterized protein n=1 Tax=Scortum barcoo TaxID=214431 RepID=A0ACB8VL05_9TELE|nr:hypothetical protein L3Q82_017447 [Scortum barcoo]
MTEKRRADFTAVWSRKSLRGEAARSRVSSLYFSKADRHGALLSPSPSTVVRLSVLRHLASEAQQRPTDNMVSPQLSLRRHTDEVSCCAFSPSLLATCSGDKSLRVYSAADFSELPFSPLSGHGYGVHCCRFSSCGSHLLSCSTDGSVVVWSAETGDVSAALRHPGRGALRVCALAPDSSLLLAGASDGTAALWDFRSKTLRRCSTVSEASVVACCFSPCGQMFVTGCTKGDLKLWDADISLLLAEKDAHDLGVSCCSFAPQFHVDGCCVEFRLASCGQDSQLKIWIVSQREGAACAMKLLHTLTSQTAPVLSCCFSSDGELVVSGYVTAVALSPTMPWIATGSIDGTVNVWRLGDEVSRTGKLLTELFRSGIKAVGLPSSHQSTKSMMTFLYSQSFPSDTHPTMAVSSENFWRWQLSVEYVKSDVYRVKRKGERTVPWRGTCAADHHIGHTVLQPHKLGPVRQGSLQQVDDGIIHPNAGMVCKLQGIHVWAHQGAEVPEDDDPLQCLHQPRRLGDSTLYQPGLQRGGARCRADPESNCHSHIGTERVCPFLWSVRGNGLFASDKFCCGRRGYNSGALPPFLLCVFAGRKLPGHSRLLVADWSEEDVQVWLREEGLQELVSIFKTNNNIDGPELGQLNKETAAELGIESVGLRGRLLRKIEALKAEQSGSEAPDEFLCPITRELMKDPVIAADGYSYERESIECWIRAKNKTSPMTNLPLQTTLLTPNRSLKMAITRWKSSQ